VLLLSYPNAMKEGFALLHPRPPIGLLRAQPPLGFLGLLATQQVLLNLSKHGGLVGSGAQ